MSASFGFGLCEYLTDLSADERVEVCLRFARLGWTPRFHEFIGGRVARFEWRDGAATVSWVEQAPFVETFRAGGGTISSSYDAFFEVDCGLIIPGLGRSSSWKERHLGEGVWVELPGTPLDGLPVSDAESVIAETKLALAEAEEETDADDADAEYDLEVKRRFLRAWTLGVDFHLIWSFSELLRDGDAAE